MTFWEICLFAIRNTVRQEDQCIFHFSVHSDRSYNCHTIKNCMSNKSIWGWTEERLPFCISLTGVQNFFLPLLAGSAIAQTLQCTYEAMGSLTLDVASACRLLCLYSCSPSSALENQGQINWWCSAKSELCQLLWQGLEYKQRSKGELCDIHDTINLR